MSRCAPPMPVLTMLLDGLECGGAYMKLLQDNAALHAEEFSNASPYVIMFGPDKCGATNKVRSQCSKIFVIRRSAHSRRELRRSPGIRAFG